MRDARNGGQQVIRPDGRTAGKQLFMAIYLLSLYHQYFSQC